MPTREIEGQRGERQFDGDWDGAPVLELSQAVFFQDSEHRLHYIGVNAWPREAMRATSSEEPLAKLHCRTTSLRPLLESNQRLKNGRGRWLTSTAAGKWSHRTTAFALTGDRKHKEGRLPP
jgi:catechol-2,3-dioxygenase